MRVRLGSCALDWKGAMTARKNLKRIIRSRMRRTGESYTAARRHFLVPKDLHMKTRANRADETALKSTIDQLQLTVKTTATLRNRGIETVGQLIEATSGGMDSLGLAPEKVIEVREVLASRGL